MEMEFLVALMQIMMVNIVLSGDNAVVIALAARNLPARQQKQAILWGSGGAIVLRIILTIAAVALLKIPSLKTFECTVVDSATGFQLVVTSRSATPVRAFSASRKDVDDAPPSLSAASLRAGFTADKAQKKPGKPRGKVTRTLFDEMKERLLRLSPDVLEEQDGDVVSFRIGDNLLAQVTRTDDALLVSTGAEPWGVEGEEGVAQAMDAVFRHFFNLQTTRRRMASLEARGAALDAVEHAAQQVLTHGDGDNGRQVASG